jgi:isoleucyl-tRNA synthetase
VLLVNQPYVKEIQDMAVTVNFNDLEQAVLSFWEQQQTFQKTLDNTKDQPKYHFYDGPPFATGLPHHGHLLASTVKDIIPRYYTMLGYHVERRFGWDCHGLPIEHEIDKQLGQSTHEIIQAKGLPFYQQACRSIVQRYTTAWEKTITRIGRWVDFKDNYKTMDLDFMESVWWVFHQLWQKDLIYQGKKIVPYSPALGTVLSNFEAGSNYQDVDDPAITVLFYLPAKKWWLAVFTTTPWTLPANLGLCVGPDVDYVLLKMPDVDDPIVIARNRVTAYDPDEQGKIIESIQASELAGMCYEPLFDWYQEAATNKGAFEIFMDDFVQAEEGTGIVHMAPNFGEDDYRVMQKAGVNFDADPLNTQGCFADTKDFSGLFIKDADPLIIKQLKNRGQLWKHTRLVHAYPMCPRSDQPLIYRAIQSWFVKVETLKAGLLKANESIAWMPAHIKDGRFGKWLAQAKDWAISRNRVWGTPLPVWQNDQTGAFYCIDSVKTLNELTGKHVTDLHREHVDDLTFELPGEKGTYRRISDVLDCWFESGSMPYAQKHYPFANQQDFEASFPANFIAEGLDQTRGWFYTLTVLAVALFDKPAFKQVLVTGIVMAEDGKKMSKRFKNYTPPDDLLEKHGADALRLYLIHSGLVKGEPQRFKDSGVEQMIRSTLLPWINAYRFYATYKQIDGWQPDSKIDITYPLDRWILSRLQTLKQCIRTHMQSYALSKVVPELILFIDDLTNGYVRLNRARFWGDGLNQDKCQAYQTLHTVLSELSLCMAPFTPFLSEALFQAQQLKPLGQSVHEQSFPTVEEQWQDQALDQSVKLMRSVLTLGRQLRQEGKVKVKMPLSQLTIIHQDQQVLEKIKPFVELIQKELNIKQVSWDTNTTAYMTYQVLPNAPVLGKRLGKRYSQVKQALAALSQSDCQQLCQSGKISVLDEIFSLDDLLIRTQKNPGTFVAADHDLAVCMDMDLTQELIQEGLAREVINRIQKTRKTLAFKVNDRVVVSYFADQTLQVAIKNHQSFIEKETLSQLNELDADQEHHHQVDDHHLSLSISLLNKT